MRPAFLLVLTLCFAGCSEPWPREPFAPEAWKGRPWQERYVLCNDLLDSKVLDDATRERVVELLGEPNGTVKPDRISYLVRHRSFKVFDRPVFGEVKVLDIRFDQEGRVTKYFVRGT